MWSLTSEIKSKGSTERDIFEISAESTMSRLCSGMASPLLSGNAQFNNCVQLFFPRPRSLIGHLEDRIAAALCPST